MAPKDDGGAAFARPASSVTNGSEGMSLRDWFAGQALAGILGNNSMLIALDVLAKKRNVPLGEIVSEHSYGQADTMLNARGN